MTISLSFPLFCYATLSQKSGMETVGEHQWGEEEAVSTHRTLTAPYARNTFSPVLQEKVHQRHCFVYEEQCCLGT